LGGLVVLAVLSGCGFRTLKKDLEPVSTLSGLEGRAALQREGDAPIVVVVYTAAHVVDLFVLPRPGPFYFALPPGTYRLAAFADANRDLTYQPEREPAARAR
jgi:hypothetical protein